jgi:zinc protease
MPPSLVATLLLLASGTPSVETLDNGLTVVTMEMDYAPVVATVVTYAVGSRDEADGVRGISHFVEHMMFKGTPGMPKARFWQVVQRDGGWANAWTGSDATTYFTYLPSSRLIDALSIESDRMHNCLFDSAEVSSERGVVAEENRMGLDDADNVLWTAMASTAYTVHPYRHPVIGYAGDIDAFDRESALAHYRTWYVPSNAVLAIVGDIDSGEALRLVDSLFGDIPGAPAPQRLLPAEPPQDSLRRVAVTHDSNLSRLEMAFHVPAADHPDIVPLRLIATLLSDGRSSRLEGALDQAGLTLDSWAWCDQSADPGLFVVYASVMPGTDPDTVEAVVWELLEELSASPVTPGEMEELACRARAEQVLSSSSPLGLALQYSSDMALYGDPLMSQKALDAMGRATPADLAAAAGRWLVPSNATVALLEPSGGHSGGRGGMPSDGPDMEAPSSISFEGLDFPPELLRPPSRSVSEGTVVVALDNCMTVVLKEDHTFPIAAIRFHSGPAGLAEPVGLAGLAAVTVSSMLRGAGGLPYAEFHGRLESRGSYLSFEDGMERSGGSITLLSEYLDTGVESVADLLIRPALADSDVALVLEEQTAALDMRMESIFQRASDGLLSIVLRDPEEARIPTRESLEAITPGDVREFHRLSCRPSGTVLVIVGDIDPDEALDLVEREFGSWRDPSEPAPPLLVPDFSDLPGDTSYVEVPGRNQTAVYAGVPGPGLGSPDYPAFRVADGILGSGIGSRLGHYVRDDQGLAYAVGSYLSAIEERGLWTAYLSTSNATAGQAALSVRAECDRLCGDGVLPEELMLEQASSAAGHSISYSGYGAQAGYLAWVYAAGFDPDWDRTLLERITALEPGEVREAAARYLGGEGWFWSFAGGIPAGE